MSGEYIIKVTRKLPEHWMMHGEIEEHYYDDEYTDDTMYRADKNINSINSFNEQATKIIIERIELIYEKYSKINGELLKIEVLDAETKKIVRTRKRIVSMYVNPEEIISRFELMDL